ncbi:MAG: hypothetical protein KAI26_09870, partial [Nanoarchaeota archaeon]|nr:hypothetical protein [Nanoarchaeota archaeon]
MTKYNPLLMLIIILSLVPSICGEENNLSDASSIAKSEDLSSATEEIIFSSTKIFANDWEANLDRTISLLAVVIAGIGVAAGVFSVIIALFIAIASGIGYHLYKTWNTAKKEMKNEIDVAKIAVNEIKEIQKRAEKEINVTIRT